MRSFSCFCSSLVSTPSRIILHYLYFLSKDMSSYKITYFNGKALAEPMRLLLSYGNVDFEDVRIEFEDWPAIKPTMPMGQMPILEVDGKKIHQSMAMTRFLAKKVGLVGANDWEDLEIDSVVDTINDLRAKIAAVNYEADEAVKAKKQEPLNKETIPFYLEKLEAIAKENNGHFALGKLTWADFYFTGILEYLNFISKRNLTDGYPNLKKVFDTVSNLESVKKWIAKRPQTDF